MHYSADGRCSAFGCSIHCSNYLHSELTLLTFIWMAGMGLVNLLATSISLPSRPWKRFVFVIKLKKKLPILNMSDLVVNGAPLRMSGATYPGVPHFSLVSASSVVKQARPRSDMHIFISVLSINRMLSGLMSLWMIPFRWIKSTARISWFLYTSWELNYYAWLWFHGPQSSSLNLYFFYRCLSMEPYYANTITKLMVLQSRSGSKLT